MLTQPFTHGAVNGFVRSRYRYTSIIEAQYTAYILEANPRLREIQMRSVEVPTPLSPDHPLYKNDEYRTKREDEWLAAQAKLALEYPVEASLMPEINRFTALAARISVMTGRYTFLPNGRMDKDSVLAALEDFLQEDEPKPSDTPDSLWAAIAAAVAELDKPITPIADRPPEALTPAEQADPLSGAADSSDKSG